MNVFIVETLRVLVGFQIYKIPIGLHIESYVGCAINNISADIAEFPLLRSCRHVSIRQLQLDTSTAHNHPGRG